MASALAGLFSVGQTATSPGIPVYNVPPLDQSAASTTPYATVFGTTMASGNSVFQAIPTAAAPVGALRFAAPTVMADIGNYNANTDRSCLNLGASAVNATSARLGVDPFVGVEDCIGVDIFTNLDASTPGAVAAWIHGGGFTQQDSSAFVYGDTNTDYFPDSGIVNVNIKYRLGPLGFLAHPELTAEAGQSGNYGLMDSIWALRWIKYNIANFKGDPTRVTVFGESAGGAHVMMVLASPIATGFFSRAIAQSPYISFGASTYSMSARESMGEYGATMAGCAPGVGQLACMRGIARTDDDFLKLASFINARDYNNYGLTSTIARPDIFLYNWVQSWPVVDGLYLTAAPLVAYAAGVNGAVDVIIGHNSDEYSMFDMVMNYFDGTPALNVPVDENWLLANYDPSLDLKASDDWNTIVAGIESIQAKAPAFGPLYYADVPENTATIDGMFSVPDYSKGIQARTDAWFTTGTHKCINALTSSGRSGSVRRYLFAEPTPAGVAAFLPTAFGIDFFGAYHGSELTYVWGFYKKAPMQGSYLQAAFFGSSFPAGPTAEQITMGDTMHTYWVDHMKTGSAGSNWPAAVAGQPIPMMVFASLLPGGAAVNPCIQPTACASESAENFRAKKVAFWSGEATTLTPTLPCCTDRRALLFGGQPACDPSPNCESAPYAREACDSPTVLITQNSMYDTSRGVAPALCDA